MEDGELVAVVLEEEVERVARSQLEAVRAGRGVLGRQVALGDAVAEGDQSAGLVRSFVVRMLLELAADRLGDYHQWPRSIAASGSSASQKSAERYFQPPSAS